ncbi:transposase [Natrinema gari JCM 14663]|uniref:Transposase n=1 Tax=Natrinema gari JCM 14663 TaxID=1230459 RepID=L9ZAE4_9EURY|nr:transposase [Natrinema gari JCM 14663]
MFSTQNEGVLSILLSELTEKHDVEDTVFLTDSATWLKVVLHHHGLRFRYEEHGNRNAVERVFRETKRRATPKLNQSTTDSNHSTLHGISLSEYNVERESGY